MDENAYSRRSVLRLAALAGVPVGAVSEVAAHDPNLGSGGGDELLVGIEEGTAADAVSQAVPSTAEVRRTNDTLGYAVVGVDGDLAAVADRIERRPEVTYVERNHEVSLDAVGGQGRRGVAAAPSTDVTPDDPLFGEQAAPSLIDLEQAWETTRGDGSVTIAVVDQGTKYDHEDLAANMDDSVDNNGTDIVDGDGDPYPDTFGGDGPVEAHGTQVAGIAGAVTDNGTGVAGVSDCSLLAVRVLDENESGSLDTVADGIQWAADNGADVINISLGTTCDSESSVIGDAVDYATENGAMTVGSAGNNGDQLDIYCPGSQCTLAVSATNENDTLAWFSNYGPYVDVAAPGVGPDTETTYPADDNDQPADEYASFSGTSMSAPVVSGIAGLVASAAPDDWGPERIAEHVRQTAEDVGLDEEKQGDGRVNAARAVERIDPLYRVAVRDDNSDLDVTDTEDVSVWVDVTNVGGLEGSQDLELLVGGEQRAGSTGVAVGPYQTDAYTFDVPVDTDDDGAELRVRVDDDETTRTLSVTELSASVELSDQASGGATVDIGSASATVDYAVVLSVDGNRIGVTGPTTADTTLDGASCELDARLDPGTVTVTAVVHYVDGEQVGDPMEIDGKEVSASATVTVDPAVPYANGDDVVDTAGLGDAVADWRSGALPTDAFLDVLDAWQSAATVPR